MKRSITALTLVVLALVTANWASAATVPQPPQAPTAEDSSQAYQAGIYGGYSSAWAESDSGVYYPYGSGGPGCRNVGTKYAWKNIYGITMWQYGQAVHWCWNFNSITEISRSRGVQCCGYLWSFDGHIGTNCTTYTDCHGRTGVYSTSVDTQGKFHACTVYVICLYKYPYLTTTVEVGGGWYWNAWS